MAEVQQGAGAVYRGADRRAVARPASRGAWWLFAWPLPAGAVVAALATAVSATHGPLASGLWLLALGVWSTLCFSAGVALLVAWRVGGWAASARLGTATVAAAALVTVVPRLTQAVGEAGSTMATRPLVIAAVLLGTGVCSTRALNVPAVDTSLRPLRELVVHLAVTLAALLVIEGAMAGGLLRDVAAVQALPVAACVATTAWMTLAGAWTASPRAQALVASWALLAAAFWWHASSGPGQDVVAAGLLAMSASLLVALAFDALRTALAAHDLRSLRTLAALVQHSDDAVRARERRHDALNALAAIRSASDVLTSSSTGLDERTRHELAEAARAELSRVERLLGSGGDVAEGVPLGRLLGPLLHTWRRRGLDIEVDTGLADAVAGAVHDPDAVCRIVDNLLQNVHRHAGGSAVRLSAERVGGDIRVLVVDDGPGIAADQRFGLFAQRTTSSPGQPGQGIGLAAARHLAREVGGDLELLTSQTGARFALTLPAGVRPAAPVPVRVPVQASVPVPVPVRVPVPVHVPVQASVRRVG